MHPGAGQRRHQSRAVQPLSLIATSGGLQVLDGSSSNLLAAAAASSAHPPNHSAAAASANTTAVEASTQQQQPQQQRHQQQSLFPSRKTASTRIGGSVSVAAGGTTTAAAAPPPFVPIAPSLIGATKNTASSRSVAAPESTSGAQSARQIAPSASSALAPAPATARAYGDGYQGNSASAVASGALVIHATQEPIDGPREPHEDGAPRHGSQRHRFSTSTVAGKANAITTTTSIDPQSAVGRSSALAPRSSAVPSLPPLPPRGYAGRRLHSHTSAEQWIDSVIARYGGLNNAGAEGLPEDDVGALEASGPTLPAITAGPDADPDDESGALVPALQHGSESQLVPRAPSPAHEPPPPAQSYTTVHGARLRKHIYALCQQLIVDATKHDAAFNSAGHRFSAVRRAEPLISVEVREHGQVVWHSAGCDEAEIDATELAVEAVDEDVKEVRRRAKRAFHATVSAFKTKLEELKTELAAARADAAAKDAGGSLYRNVIAELENVKSQNRQLQSKVKALLKLLERAGATIKHQEEQQVHDQAMSAAGAGLGTNAPDWSSARAVIPDLVIEDREGPGILRDIVDAVERLNSRLAEVEASNEIFSEKFADKDAQCDQIRRERDGLAVKLRLQEAGLESLRNEVSASAAEILSLRQQLEEQRKAAETERDRLILQNMEAEKAIRKTVESKPFFIGQGRGLGVPVYLRFEGKVRNLDMPKKDVEDLINAIWAARDIYNAVKRAQKAIDARDKVARGEKVEDALATINFGSGNSAEQLIDYDNIRFVKRIPGPFAEHVALFLIEKFGGGATADGGGEGGDGDGEQSPRKGRKANKDKDKAAAKLPTRAALRKYGFTMSPAVAEYAYSLMEGCEKFKYDADIELFRRVAKFEISEMAYFDQMIMLVKLRAALQQASRTQGSGGTSLTVTSIIEVIKRFFPTKPAESVELLRRSLILEIPDGQNMSEIGLASIRIGIAKLFASNEHGNQGSFMEAVRDQHLEEVCTYVSEICDAISACSSLPECRGKIVPLYFVRRRLHELDPLKPMEDINRFLLNALAVYNAEEDDDDSVPKSNAIHLNSEVDVEKLANASKLVFAKRYGPKGNDAATAVDAAVKQAMQQQAANEAEEDSGLDEGDIQVADDYEASLSPATNSLQMPRSA